MLKRIFPDRFIFWLIGAVLAASLLPVRGLAAAALDGTTFAAIFALFFLHGVRLPREALVGGLTDWRLHLAILASTYAVFPLVGLAVAALFPGTLSPPLWTGILFPGAAAGFVILPVMLFHILQLIVCAWIAARLGRQNSPSTEKA